MKSEYLFAILSTAAGIAFVAPEHTHAQTPAPVVHCTTRAECSPGLMCIDSTCTTLEAANGTPSSQARPTSALGGAAPAESETREIRIGLSLVAGYMHSVGRGSPVAGANLVVPFFYGAHSDRLEFRLQAFDSFVGGDGYSYNFFGVEANVDYFLAQWIGIHGRVGVTAYNSFGQVPSFGLGGIVGAGFFVPVGTQHGLRFTLGVAATFTQYLIGDVYIPPGLPDDYRTDPNGPIGGLGSFGVEFAF